MSDEVVAELKQTQETLEEMQELADDLCSGLEEMVGATEEVMRAVGIKRPEGADSTLLTKMDDLISRARRLI